MDCKYPQGGGRESDVREFRVNVPRSGIPNDAVTRDKKDHAGLEQTTGKDYGYPQQNDPSSGLKQ